jgi:hypothetical protein
MTNNKSTLFTFLLAACLAPSAYTQDGRLGSEGTYSGDGWKFFATYVAEPPLAPGQQISIKGHDDVIHADARDGLPVTFHRFFTDPASKTFIGYDVEVEPIERPGSARLRFKPFGLRASELPKGSHAADFQPLPTPQLPAETFPSGQMIAVDILKNPTTGQKVVDYIEVSYEPIHIPSKAAPRDFQISDVILHFTAPSSFLVNGAKVPPALVASQMVARKLVWLSVPGRGRFLLSLVPYSGYLFQKAGVVKGFELSFSWNGDKYELRVPQAITESSGNWNLYVLAAPPTPAPGFTFGAVNSVEEFFSKPK